MADRQGEYRLTLIAQASGGAESLVQGTLWLEANEPSATEWTGPGGTPHRTVSVPLYGWAEISVAAVGGRLIGELGSEDPMRPGVLVLEQRPSEEAIPDITLRLGSIANDRSQATFDSGYLALRIGWLDEESGDFGGSWASGVRSVEARGRFCAVLGA